MSIFKLHDQRYSVDGRELARMRVEMGKNMSEFAHKCGWTCSYQWQLENDIVESVSEATKNVIEGALK